MSKLVINLLGSPSIMLDQKPLDFQTSKATGLIAYLAINHQAHTRLELASLLWTELDKDKALAALRTTLWKLKKAGIEEWLKVLRSSVSLNLDDDIEIDVLHFQEFVAQCETHGHHPSKVCPACLHPLTEAANLYHGDFMKGFSLRDAGEFDNWQSLNSEILRQEIRQVLEKLVKGHRSQGEIEQAIHFARRWVTYDRFNEDIYRQLMTLYVISGQRAESVQLYRELVKILRRESMEPQAETTRLYQQVRSEKTEHILSSQELETPIFLTTDIENADEMWANYHEQMVRTVSRYNAIVKECTKQYGGYIVKQTGDTSILFFDKGQPVHCVLAIHKRLMRTTWTVNTIPRIRIALSAAERRQSNIDDYTTDIYRAQRILSAGWGGQVLLTTQVLNTIELPPQAQVDNLGVHMLKDLGEPLRIYRLIHPELPSREFPPLQSLSNFQQNLPNYPTVFIGREMELTDLMTLLSNPNCRLLTLIGPGGVGKTRLALQVAAQQINNFLDGIYFVPVPVPKTPDLLPSVLAETFKFTFFEQKAPLELIVDFLREKNLLLIIDNFEHLTTGSEVLSTLLDNAPGLKIMVTSRERLHLREEWLYEVHGMPYPSASDASEEIEQYNAVQLFIQNARRLVTGFDPTPDDLVAITHICQVVDGIPLAIELATAWIRTLSCQEIAREIDTSMDFLSTSLRDIPARHRSLRAVFEHSWNLLSEEGRRIFRRLAVFRGGFTADAALDIAKASPILLASLIDRSLLKRASDTRFEVIEVIRHFALNKLLESQEYNNTKDAHSTYYHDFVYRNFPGMMGSDVVSRVDTIRTEIENIRAAWKWAVDNENWSNVEKSMNGLLPYLDITGQYADGVGMFSMACEKFNSKPSSEFKWLEAGSKLGVGWSKFCIGDHIDGLHHMKEALDAFLELGKPLHIGTAYFFLAKANERINQPQLSIDMVEKSLEMFGEEVDADPRVTRALTSQALTVYGLALLRFERVKEAKEVLQESLRINQEFGQRFGSVQSLDALSRVLAVEGDLHGALSLRLQALKIARDTGNQYSIAVLLNNIAHVYTILNDLDKAMQYQQESLEISREIGHRWLTAMGLNNLAFIFLKFYYDPNEAIRLYKESLSLFRDIEDQRGMIFTLHDLGIASLEAMQLNQSRTYFLDALTKAQQLDSPEIQLYVISSIATLFSRQGQHAYACELCQLVLSHPQSGSDAKQRTDSLMDEIEMELSTAQIQSSIQHSQSAILEKIVADLLVSG